MSDTHAHTAGAISPVNSETADIETIQPDEAFGDEKKQHRSYMFEGIAVFIGVFAVVGALAYSLSV